MEKAKNGEAVGGNCGLVWVRIEFVGMRIALLIGKNNSFEGNNL